MERIINNDGSISILNLTPQEYANLFNPTEPEKAEESTKPTNFEKQVTQILDKLGIPRSIKGYGYLRESIILAYENKEYLESFTGSLYPTIALNFNTTPSRVERAIRHSIEVACSRGDIGLLKSLFGLGDKRFKPTNSEFIAYFADELRLKRGDILGSAKELDSKAIG